MEKKLDWIALHGVNLMLVDGTEIIWQKTLQQFGFSDKEIKEFIPGPAFYGLVAYGHSRRLGRLPTI